MCRHICRCQACFRSISCPAVACNKFRLQVMSKDLSSAEVLTEVLQHLCDENDGKPPSPSQLAEALDMPVKAAKEILKELAEDGVLPVKTYKRSAEAGTGSDAQPDKEDPGIFSESAPKVPKIPKRLKRYVAEKAVNPNFEERETQDFENAPCPASSPAAPASGTPPKDESVVPASSQPSKAMDPKPTLPKGDSQRQGPPNAPCIFVYPLLVTCTHAGQSAQCFGGSSF